MANFQQLLVANEHTFDILMGMELGGSLDANADVLALEESVDSCFATHLTYLTRDEVSDRNVILARVTAKIDALRIDAVDQGEHVDVGGLSDNRNVANHLATVTNADPAPVRADALLGRWLRSFPELADAHAAGSISTAHLTLLRLADNVRVHNQMVEDQEKFVSWFKDVAFRDLPHVIDRWLLGADPDGQAPDVKDQETGLSIKPLPGGGARISGVLDPIQAAALRDDIEAEAQTIRRQHQEDGIASTVRHRTLHALMNLVGRGAARPDGTFARPRINIVMSQEVFEQTAKWLEDPINEFPELDPLGRDPDRKCQLIDGTPVHPLYGYAASVTATMRRQVFDARSRPIDVSSNARSIPDWMKETQLIVSNGKCSNPVCDAPFAWLHADHVIPHSHTQNTSLKNTRPLCEPENLWRSNDTSRGVWNESP